VFVVSVPDLCLSLVSSHLVSTVSVCTKGLGDVAFNANGVLARLVDVVGVSAVFVVAYPSSFESSCVELGSLHLVDPYALPSLRQSC
jgi:hypothetical protein